MYTVYTTANYTFKLCVQILKHSFFVDFIYSFIFIFFFAAADDEDVGFIINLFN